MVEGLFRYYGANAGTFHFDLGTAHIFCGHD